MLREAEINITKGGIHELRWQAKGEVWRNASATTHKFM